MPRLLQINTTQGRGSTGKIAEKIASLAIAGGWDCYLAHGPRFVGDTCMESIQVSSAIDEKVHFAASRLFDMHGLGSCASTRKFIDCIDEIKPDIVHLHNLHGYYLNYRLLLEHLSGKGYPTVITMHDFWLMTGHCAYINKSCGKWENGCGNCPRLGEYPAAILDRSRKNWELKNKLFSSFSSDKLVLVPVSDWLASYVRRSLLGSRDIFTIANGVDTGLFRPYEGQHSDLYKSIDWNRYTVLAVADRWTEANGFYTITEWAGNLPSDMQLILVGLNQKQMQGLPERVIGIGHIGSVNELVELYSAADALLNVSTEVTFGLVTAEAMACGTPAIVFKNTAGEDIIDDNTGFSVDSLDQVPELVYKCRKEAAHYSGSCRCRIMDQFEANHQYSKYLALYSSLLNM